MSFLTFLDELWRKKNNPKNSKNPKLWPRNFWHHPKLYTFGWPLLTCTRVPNLGSLGLRVSQLEGIRLKKQYCPLGTQFWPLGADSPNGTQFRPRRFWPESLGSRPLPVWAATLTQHFPKGSRGSTWHVTGGTQRHVTAAIVVALFRRIEWAVSRPDRPSRSSAIYWAPVVH